MKSRGDQSHVGDPDGHRAGKRRHLHAQRISLPWLNSYSQIFSSEVSGVALKRFFLLFIPGDAGGLLSLRIAKCGCFSSSARSLLAC